MEQLTLSLDDYIEIKQKIKEKLNETVHNFIIIGYYLKKVRDSGAFCREGYRNMEEFARAEYGLSAATASRFMDINTEFSKDGNSVEIKDEYRGFAYSKLQEMLTVMPEDRELVTEHTTVQQIREIKKAEKEERKAEAEAGQRELPLLQTASEHTDDKQGTVPAAEPEDPFGKILAVFWKEGENRELYTKAAAGLLTPGIAAEEICPSGSRTYRKGTDMLFFYDFDRGLKLRSYEGGKPVITQYSYKELLERTADIAADGDNTPYQMQKNGEPEETIAASQNDGQQKQMNTEIHNNSGAAVNSETENVIDCEYRELGNNGTESEKCLNIVKAGLNDGKRTADENMEKSIKAFSIPHEKWYKDTVLEEPHIYVGMYYESGGTDGEFRIVWDNIGIQLRAYNDSWEVLYKMPELIDLMAKIDREKLNPTVKEFAEMLKELGYKEMTERVRK